LARVLIAGFTALPGPHRIGVQLRHVVRALVRYHKVDVLVLRRGEQSYVERMGNARILRVPVPEGEIRGRVEAFRRALRRQLEGADYDIVHFSDGWAGQTVLELAPRLKFATVYDAGRSPLTGPLPLDVSVVSELEQTEARCAASADLVLAPTEPARQYLANLASPQRVHLVAPGVDVDLFDWDLPAPTGPPVVLYVGTLSQGRGIQVLLGAMLELLRRGDAELVLAGRAGREFRQSLANTVRDLGIEGRVRFAGVVEHAQVPELIAKATVCVSPGAPEITTNRLAIYPTKLLEYLACQRAVVAARRSSVSLLIRDGQTGLLFEPGQPADLADKLHRLIGDSSLRARLARAGYDLVRRAHSASSTRRELRAAYGWLASISPWRERLAAETDDLVEGEIRLPGVDDTEATGWPKRAGEAVPGFDSSELVVEMMIEEGTGSSSLETQLGEPAGEVTRVEVSPLLAESDTRSTALYPIDQQKADDWVVEAPNTRPVEQSGELGDRAAPPVKPGSPVSSNQASFVSGEISGGDATDEIVIGDAQLAAVGALLGSLDEDEKTRLFALPSRFQEPPAPFDPDSMPTDSVEAAEPPSRPADPEANDDQTQIAYGGPPVAPPGRGRAASAAGARRRAARVAGDDPEAAASPKPFAPAPSDGSATGTERDS
jgi:glycosyltransferase involved in cell wall biosynthesis